MPTLKIPTPNLFSGYALLHGTESTTDSLCPTINIIIILININKPGSKLQKYPKESWLTQSPLKWSHMLIKQVNLQIGAITSNLYDILGILKSAICSYCNGWPSDQVSG